MLSELWPRTAPPQLCELTGHGWSCQLARSQVRAVASTPVRLRRQRSWWSLRGLRARPPAPRVWLTEPHDEAEVLAVVEHAATEVLRSAGGALLSVR